jgi:uncharacterized protein
MPTYLSPGVYVQEMESGSRPIEGVGTAVAAFVGLAPKGPQNEPTLIANWTQFVDNFGDFIPGSYLAHAVYGYFLNGGGLCYVVRVGASSSAGKSSGRPKSVNAPASVTIGNLLITAKAGGANAKPVTVEVGDATGENQPEGAVKFSVASEGKPTEVWEAVSVVSGRDGLATKVSTESKLVTVEEIAEQPAPVKLDKGSFELVSPVAAPEPPNMEKLAPGDYVGDPADRTGFSGLEAIDEVTMVAVPDLLAAYEQGAIDLEGVKAVQLAIIAHCELMGDRVAILDTPPGLSVQQVKEWRQVGAGYDSKFATAYYPWIKVFDPSSGVNRFVPPSGHIAGIWARSDDTRGVHKAPANEVIRGVISLETGVTKNEQELLNPIGLNVIRTFPGRGTRVWGARTLSSDADWRYLNVRRLFNYLEESILIGTQFAVFEPNDPALWSRIRRTISAFLVNEWRKGALFGLTPEEAFYVKCDEETNPAEGIDAGQVVCQIGVAPVKPAEFVIFQLSQFSGGTSLVNE